MWQKDAKLEHKGFKIATVAGLPIRIDPSWFIIVALLSWTLATGYFPAKYKGFTTATYWVIGVAAAILLFVSVLLHELGHAYLAKRCNLPAEGITLFLFGGVSELPGEPTSPGDEAKVTLGGWLVSALIAAICYAISLLLRGTGTGSVVAMALFQYLAVVNTLLFVFNGIPGLPLDGGRLCRALVWKATGSIRKATSVASSIGTAFGTALIVLAVINVFFGSLIGGLWLGLIGLFLRASAQASYRQLVIRRALKGMSVGDLMSSNVVTVSPAATISEAMDQTFMKHHYHGFPVVEDGHVQGIISLHDLKQIDREAWERTTVGQVIESKNRDVVTLHPQDDAMDAFATMTKSGRGRLPVVENGELVGILSRRDVLHMLAVKTDLVPEE